MKLFWNPEPVVISSNDLRNAADVIDDESHWVQGTLSVDVDGDLVDPTDPNAVRWCGVGAVCLVLGRKRSYAHRVEQVLALIDGDSVALSLINDNDGHDATIAELRRIAGLVGRKVGGLV